MEVLTKLGMWRRLTSRFGLREAVGRESGVEMLPGLQAVVNLPFGTHKREMLSTEGLNYNTSGLAIATCPNAEKWNLRRVHLVSASAHLQVLAIHSGGVTQRLISQSAATTLDTGLLSEGQAVMEAGMTLVLTGSGVSALAATQPNCITYDSEDVE